jgi:hypothetical protein
MLEDSFYVIRTGQSEWNRLERVMGWIVRGQQLEYTTQETGHDRIME